MKVVHLHEPDRFHPALREWMTEKSLLIQQLAEAKAAVDGESVVSQQLSLSSLAWRFAEIERVSQQVARAIAPVEPLARQRAVKVIEDCTGVLRLMRLCA
ncbi:hypothetical protein SAMN05880582_11042 [Rhizobium sp. RU20A]|uniref:hypothetical protein n=1 Tax=Rhizobium sp. RU20A TaxID=1907412 RepID=UPI0009542B9B|nr:hypothetical protein [Rhizobium sp. RU20A]SIR32393.1 hypothetical protein SAMN05880582_11042 [Rhizobium sp. RU20A]